VFIGLVLVPVEILAVFVFISLLAAAVIARLKCGAVLRWCETREKVLYWLASSAGLVYLGLLTYLAGLALALGIDGSLALSAYVVAFASAVIWTATRITLGGAVLLVFSWTVIVGLFAHIYLRFLPVMDPVHAAALSLVPLATLLVLAMLLTPGDED